MVNHLLERLGNLGGVRDGFADSRGFGGTEIGGLDPLPLLRRFRAAFGPAIFWPAVTRGFARRFGGTRRLRRVGGFRDGFGLVSFLRPGFVRGKFGRHFRVRFAKIAGGISFVFRVLGVFRRFGWRRGGFNGLRRGRNSFDPGRTGFGRYRTRTAATATTTTATATIPGGTTRRGRIQIGLFVRHKIVR
jgi:hypothetical protein